MTARIRGTVAELAAVLTINGQTVNEVTLYAILRGLSGGDNPLAREVASVRTGQRGKPLKIWEVNSGSLNFGTTTAFASETVAKMAALEAQEAAREEAKRAIKEAKEKLAALNEGAKTADETATA